MDGGEPDQPAARLPGALAAAARPGDHHLRLGLLRRLVRARTSGSARGMMASLSGNLATMGPGVPTPSRRSSPIPTASAIALVGDGAMQMIGNNGLITIAKYWQRWSDPRLVDLRAPQQRPQPGDLGAARLRGRPEVRAQPDAARLPVRALRRAARPQRASASTTPTRRASLGRAPSRPTGRSVVEAITDPDVPPLPPHITSSRRGTSCSAWLAATKTWAW